MRAAVCVLSAATAALAVAPTETQHCLALPNRSPSDLGYAISVVCNPKNLDCAPINVAGAVYYPNTIYHHCNWAFDKYWSTVGQKNASFCTDGPPGVPQGKAGMFNCSSKCTKCQMKKGTTDAAANGVIGYLCASTPEIMGPLCTPINKGGDLANKTAPERASYVTNLYYQGVKCDLPQSACDFSSNGEVVDC